MSLLLDVFDGKVVHRPPVWFMRQAGRVLKSYRDLRQKYSFETLLKTPELAIEVTLQPVRDLGVDAAILFSDILVVPEALGLKLEFSEQGPRFEKPLIDKDDLCSFSESLNYICEVIKGIKKSLPPDIPLIGFCGAPLTVFCYMVEGSGGDGSFPKAFKWLYSRTKESEQVLDAITEMSVQYVEKQIESGIDVFQLFETWAGQIPYSMYQNKILPRVKEIFLVSKKKRIPSIFFPRGLGAALWELPVDIANGLSIDWQTSLEKAFLNLPEKWVLQGNIDPRLMYHGEFQKEHIEYYHRIGKKHSNWIVNLGHGILPGTSEQKIRELVNWVKQTDWQRDLQ